MDLRRSRALRLFGAVALGAILISACASPFTAAPSTVYRIGYLSQIRSADSETTLDTLRQALRDLGYVEGRNLSLEVIFGDGDQSRLPSLAAEMIARKPDVVVGRGPPVKALMQASSAVPLVFVGLADPVETGFVTSMAHPGGNVTGTARAGAETAGRRLQLLKEALPGASRVAFLFDASRQGPSRAYEATRSAASSLGLELMPIEVRAPGDFDAAFAAIERARPDAVGVEVGALTGSQRQPILDFLSASRLPSMCMNERTWVDLGCLLFYDSDLADEVKRSAVLADRILKGASPADLPVESATKFVFIINLKTAKALGLTIPPSVLAQATELIQ